MTDKVEYNELPILLDDLRDTLNKAEQSLKEHPTYYNAVWLQKVRRQYEQKVKEERAAWHIMAGDLGLHTRTPLEIAVDALKEINDRSVALELEFSYIDFGNDRVKPFRFLGQVARHALKDMGNEDS